MFIKLIPLLVFLFLIHVSIAARAARVVKIKNQTILIDLENDSLAVGQNILLINAKNMKVAIAKVTQVKNRKALAQISKGASQGNEVVKALLLSLAPASGSATTPKVPTAVGRKALAPESTSASAKKISILATLISNSMTTKQFDSPLPSANPENVSLTGTTVGFTGAIDLPVLASFDFRGTLGYEPFKAAATSVANVCDSFSTTNCTVEINYLSIGSYFKYNLNQGPVRFWGALGGTFKFPLSKTSTALKVDEIKAIVNYGATLGADYYFNERQYIPLSIEQQFFLKTETVSSSIMMIRIGFGWVQ